MICWTLSLLPWLSACQDKEDPHLEAPIITWIQQASVIVQADGNCDKMATALSGAWLKARQDVEAARAALTASSNGPQALERLEKFVGPLVDSLEQRYSYCALDPRFRERLSVALKVAGPIEPAVK